VWLLTRVERHRPHAFVNRLLLILVLLGASGCSAEQGVFGGSPATPSATSTIKISLPPEPPLVLAALQQLVQESNPQLVQRIDSVAVKYVTDHAFWHAISNAWKSGNPASCGTGSDPSPNGHLYVVDLHGKFVDVGRSVPGGATTYVSVMVGEVPAADLPVPFGSFGFSHALVGADGQPLCWSFLPG
jgi:hypothetical protein